MDLKLPSGRIVQASDVADALELPSPDLVEKDFHVVRALRAIGGVGNDDYRLVFAGGTALARAHRIIRRMSEDIDLKVVPIGSDDSNKKLRTLRTAVMAGLTNEGFQVAEPAVRNKGRYIRIELDYPRANPASSFLRPQIQVELTRCQLRADSVDLPVASFAAEATGENPEITALACCSVTETAAEKLVSLTRRIACDLESPGRVAFDPTLVRHLYDLQLLQGHFDDAVAPAMAAEIAQSDAEQFGAQYPAYRDNPQARTLEALNALETQNRFRDQYRDFVTAMVYGSRPSYDEALDVLRGLIARMW